MKQGWMVGQGREGQDLTGFGRRRAIYRHAFQQGVQM